MDNLDVTQCLPQRYPFLFIDKIIACDYLKFAKACKAITYNEWFFQGHFPNNPILPGNIMVEMMAQTVGVMLYSKTEKLLESDFGYMAKCNVKFFEKIEPGVILTTEATCLGLYENFCKAKVATYKNETLVAGGEIIISFR